MDGSSPHFRSEYRCDSPTQQRWFEMRVNPLATPEDGIVLCHSDTSELTKARSNMSRKLIEAQEQERARIARELHDDINQRLAMLALELEQLQNDPSEIQQRVSELRKQTNEISNDVQALSHELHSSKLEYFGAVRGVKSWSRNSVSGRDYRLNSKALTRKSLCPRKSDFACSGFYRKPCTMPPSTAGRNGLKCNSGQTRVRFISSSLI
jgi:chromosome segregation ATPase